MKKFSSLLVCCFAVFFVASGQVKHNQIPLRADSWFGLHFDLHAPQNLENAGETLTEEMITDLLKRVKPDYIQVDCKGHGGISSYPTEVGFPVKGFEKDPMALWRKVTLEHGVGLYVHFSGVFDRKVVEVHPDYAVLNPDSTRDTKMTSVFGPYVDKYLIPQLKELSSKYKIDGAWIDGECWAVKPDYAPEVLELFTKETGISEIPYKPEDEGYVEFIEFQRRYFMRYIQHYVKAIHESDPDFQVTSNWAFSSMMPVEARVDLDYLSGDLQPFNAVYSAAFESRCLASQGKPWDLMAWSFNWSPDRTDVQHSTKSSVQLKQEAAQVISSGGGIQFYFRQNRDLSIQPWTIRIMEELSEFCHARKPFCEDASPIKEIGIIYSGNAFLKSLPTMYASGWDAPQLKSLKGMLNAVMDNHFQADILMDHHLSDRMNDYKLVIVPEWEYLSDEVVKLLKEYVHNGGNLMLTGVNTIPRFGDILGVEDWAGQKGSRIYVQNNGRLADINASWLTATVPEGNAIDYFYSVNDLRYPSASASASFFTVGKGTITAIHFDAGSVYYQGSNPVIRDFLKKQIASQFPEPLVHVEGTKLVHAVATKKGNMLIVNMINIAGLHTNTDIFTFDEIPPLGSFTVNLALGEKPREIYLQPLNTKLSYTWKDGVASIRIPALEIHDVIEVRSK